MAREPRGARPEPQAEVIAFLCDAASFGRPGVAIDRITTHAALVFLVGQRAYKMKRAVRYSFLDFTTLARRTQALEAELELNRRTAPMLYRRLVPVTREADGRLALAGSGEPVEWLLEMTRFDQAARLDRVAERGELTPEIVDDLAAEVADFHERAARRPDLPVRRSKGNPRAAGTAEFRGLSPAPSCVLLGGSSSSPCVPPSSVPACTRARPRASRRFPVDSGDRP